MIEIGNERFRAGEALFNPGFMGIDCLGLHEVIYQSVLACDVDIRRNLLGNVVLNGGASLLTGIQERVCKEVEKKKKKKKNNTQFMC